MQSWPQVAIPSLPGVGPAVQVFDSASGKKVTPVAAGAPAKLYVCGITPYDATHIGHAATYLAFDLLQRAWIDAGSTVHYAQNVTDIDDPLLERANKVGQDWEQIAAREVRRYSDDATSLRLLPPRDFIAVTEHMDGIVRFIDRLRAAGATYQVDGDWYFSGGDFQSLRRVAQLSDEQMLAISAERGGDPNRAGKRHPLDPVLWLRERPAEPAWDSVLGRGRPGWHVECLAIASDSLGLPISVQGGGSDLLFPHHACCAAEAAALGIEFAQHYVHAGMVAYQGAKMSKSLGNLVFVSELRSAGVDPMVLRTAITSQHYRSDWEWHDERLVAAAGRLQQWRAALSCLAGADSAQLLQAVRNALADDLDTPRAMQLIDQWAEQTLAGDDSDAHAPGVVARMLDALLGLAL